MKIPDAWQRRTFVLLLFSLVGAFLLFLTWDLRPFPLGAQVDDYLYVRSAIYIKTAAAGLIQGNLLPWLGPYDPATLFKRPGISILLATLSAMHLPFIQTILLLYLAGVAVFVNSLLRLQYSRLVAIVVYVVCGLLPLLYDANSVRVIREIATAAVEISILALCLRFFGLRFVMSRQFFTTPTFLALLALLAFHWSLREEAILLLAPVLLLLNGAVWLSEGIDWRRKVRLMAVISVLVWIPSQIAYLTFATLNKSSYGLFLVNEISEGSFPRAVSALKSVEEDPCNHGLLTEAEARKVMGVSPTFSLVSENLTEAVRQRPDLIYTDAFSGMRVAALPAIIAKSPSQTQETFARIASEVDEACRDGRLRCAPRRTHGIVPLLCSSQWPMALENLIGYTRFVAEFRNSGFEPIGSGNPGIDPLHPSEFEHFKEILRQEMMGRNHDQFEFSQPASLSTIQRQESQRRAMGSAYSLAMPYVACIGIVGVALRMALGTTQGPLWFLILLATGGHAGCRVLAFSYLSAVDGYLNSRYISVCFPIAAAFVILAAREIGVLFRHSPKTAVAVAGSAPSRAKVVGGIACIVALAFLYAGTRRGIEHKVQWTPFGASGLLEREKGVEYIDFQGRRIQIRSEGGGWLFAKSGWISGDFATFQGWAKDSRTDLAAERILLFVD